MTVGPERWPEPGETAALRDEAAALRDEAGALRDEVAGLRDEVALLRAADGRARNAAGSVRDQARDRSDLVADGRDNDAGLRDANADERDRAASLLETQEGTDTLPRALARAEVAREAAAADRSGAEVDRGASAGDRDESGSDRGKASDDRTAAAEQRADAGTDRGKASDDRTAAAEQRADAGLDRDAAAKERDEAQVGLRAATRDALTGTLLRGPGLDALNRDFDRATRTGEPLTVAFIDVDGLKSVNDTGGHQAGDRLLAAVAAALVEHLRPYDVIIRYGGDEFVASLLGLTQEVAAARVNAVNTALGASPVNASVTVGLAEFEPGDTLEALIERADAALYAERARTRAGVASAP